MKINKEEKTSKNKEENKLTARAKEARSRALIKIENNIKGIYDINNLEESMTEYSGLEKLDNYFVKMRENAKMKLYDKTTKDF